MGRRGGRIVNIADVGAVRAWPGYVPYGISKAGVLMLTRGLAVALAPRIQVNAVAPGVVLLPEGFPRESGRRLAARIPMGRHGRPADVAAAVRFFATCPDYITGQVLFVDGGMLARLISRAAAGRPGRRSTSRGEAPQGSPSSWSGQRRGARDHATGRARSARDPGMARWPPQYTRGEPAHQLEAAERAQHAPRRGAVVGSAPGAMRMPPPNQGAVGDDHAGDAAGARRPASTARRTAISTGRCVAKARSATAREIGHGAPAPRAPARAATTASNPAPAEPRK